MLKRVQLLCLLVFLPKLAGSQAVSITTTGNPPDASAMLDIQSDSRGILIPRMTTAQRTGIASPATGLLVFDTTTSSFWYRQATRWVELTNNFNGLRDADGDTRVQVEESPDEDIIRFDIGGVEAMVLDESAQGATRLDIGPDHGLFIGRNAGISSFAGWNTFLGYEAGLDNTVGDRNVFIGYRAGRDNLSSIRNVFVGYESGLMNTGSFNTFLGHQTGRVNTTGHSNVFLGNDAGIQNETGIRNTFVGYNAGHNNEVGNELTSVGFSAGYNTEADRNTYYGYEAGLANRTGLFNTIIGGEAAGTNLSNRNMGNGNTLVGYESGQSANGLIENTLLGYRAGFTMTSGIRNVYAGALAGLNAMTGYANVGIGAGALRTNSGGNRNVAVGDSTLYVSVNSGNVAVGSKAGMDNTTGAQNTYVGFQAGFNTTTGSYNTLIGNNSGQGNLTGSYNTMIGLDAGFQNQSGENNFFGGVAAGFTNMDGGNNVFVGRYAGGENISGDHNIAIGYFAGTHNRDGSNNISIGQLALGDLLNNAQVLQNNVAIGYRAGDGSGGNNNIIIGNETGLNMTGSSNILIGNQIQPRGSNNMFIGDQSGAPFFSNPQKATAIGYKALATQDYSIILGDTTTSLSKVGIGTTAPSAMLDILSNGSDMFKLRDVLNQTALRVRHNGIAEFHNRVFIGTIDGKSGYELNVNGDIVCEEVLVENSDDWPDYVFDPEYPLRDFDDIRHFIGTHGHLPGIPSAEEVRQEGILVGEMQKQLLEKVEELTLYILQLEARLKALEGSTSSSAAVKPSSHERP